MSDDTADKIAERDALLQAWIKAKKAASDAVLAETQLRVQVVALLFPEPCEGTNKYELGGGYCMKLMHGYRYDLGNAKLTSPDGTKISKEAQIQAQIDKLEAEFGEGSDATALINRCIRFQPELSATEYKKLDTSFKSQARIKELIDEVLTIKPASPQLSFEEPKVK